MDTVWIRLNTVTTSDPAAEFGFAEESPEQFMFGPTGIVRFKTKGDRAELFNSAKLVVAIVTEHSDVIMDILRKMRGTEGRLNAKQNAKTKGKRKASHAKAKSKSRKSSK